MNLSTRNGAGGSRGTSWPLPLYLRRRSYVPIMHILVLSEEDTMSGGLVLNWQGDIGMQHYFSQNWRNRLPSRVSGCLGTASCE